MIEARFRPLSPWPHEHTDDRRQHPFSASWPATLELLDREIRNLRGSNVIIAAGFREQDIRVDGWPRSGARDPAHPGVEISFDSRFGRLVYASDACAHWGDNVRSIALGLEALRAVDRFGVSRRGQQYAGWKALPSGSGVATRDDAWKILENAVGTGTAREIGDNLEALYRAAARATHPDRSEGSAERFVQVQAAYEFLKASR